MGQQDDTRLTSMIELTATPCLGISAPEGFAARKGEKVLYLLENVELLELRKTEPPLSGGSGDVGYAAAQSMAAPGSAHVRSVQLQEAAPGRAVGRLVVTDRRAALLGAESTREWSFEQLRAMTHDVAVPETWLEVRNRKRISGFRYPATSALELRFWLALGIAIARNDRPALAASLSREADVLRAVPHVAVAAGHSRPVRALKRIYLGKPGGAVPARVAQGTLAALLTLGLCGALLPHQSENSPGVTAANSISASKTKAAGTAAGVVGQDPGADARATAQKAADAAAQQRTDAQAAADRAAAEQAAAAQAAADQAAAAQAAADQAAADQVAAQAAADQAAALKTADAQAAAATRATDKVAADKAAAERDAAARAAATVVAPQPFAAPAAGNCTAAYPDFCIPQRTGDAYNCPDFAQKDFTALAEDPYRLDRDKDGIACES